MDDARGFLSQPAKEAIKADTLSELLYADDTLVLGESARLVEEYGAAIERAGASYGMALHWGKTQALSICTTDRIRRPDGSVIQESGCIEYLGALLSADGRPDSEVSRRMGVASADSRKLQRLWNHANVTKKDKLHFFDSLIVSRLKSGLSTIHLVTSQCRRLVGFYCRCLRKILRIPSAFISRISNSKVLQRAGVTPFTNQILKQQQALLIKVASSAPGCILRNSTFIGETLTPQVGRYVRRIRRPRQDWISEVMRKSAFNFHNDLSQLSTHRPV